MDRMRRHGSEGMGPAGANLNLGADSGIGIIIKDIIKDIYYNGVSALLLTDYVAKNFKEAGSVGI